MVSMEILSAFYFSGTGNTKFITEYLIGKLSAGYDCALYDIASADGAKDIICRSAVILFAFPIYGSSPPIPMRSFVHANGRFIKDKKIIIAETQYFFSGDGAASLGRTIERFGGKIIGAETFNMPNNLSDCKIFPVKNGGEINKIILRAERRADSFAESILKGEARLRGFSFIAHGVGYFSQRVFWRRAEAGKRKLVKADPSRCAVCGLCVRSCPVKNLKIENGKVISRGQCVLCYRCVNICPHSAITILGSAPPKVRYNGPKV